MTGIFQVSDSGSSPDIGIRREVTARGAKWGLKVFIAQSVERATVNRKVTGSIPVKNVLEQLLEH